MTQQDTPIRVDIVSDVVCPWCVIGYRQLAEAAHDTGTALDVHWHPFELNPNMVDEGEDLREHLAAKYGTTPEDSIKARARLTELGAALGFTFNYADGMRMYNTFKAHQLIDWAEDQGKAHAAKLALFAAFFTRREDVSDPAVLAHVAQEIGLDPTAARTMLNTGTHAARVRQKQQFWTSRGVRGVPAMVFESRHLVTGAQGEDTYKRILQELTKSRVA
ncbi:MAG: DsbA family oxidoreductase [Rhodobacteraceae bacterium]|nr:DsbA family oxidoreductase [Paracoccaceae bacterium]